MEGEARLSVGNESAGGGARESKIMVSRKARGGDQHQVQERYDWEEGRASRMFVRSTVGGLSGGINEATLPSTHHRTMTSIEN